MDHLYSLVKIDERWGASNDPNFEQISTLYVVAGRLVVCLRLNCERYWAEWLRLAPVCRLTSRELLSFMGLNAWEVFAGDQPLDSLN